MQFNLNLLLLFIQYTFNLFQGMESRTVILIFNGVYDFDPMMRCTTQLILLVCAEKIDSFSRLQYLSYHCSYLNPYDEETHQAQQEKVKMRIKSISACVPAVFVTNANPEELSIGLTKILSIIKERQEQKFVILTDERSTEKTKHYMESVSTNNTQKVLEEINSRKESFAKIVENSGHACYVTPEGPLDQAYISRFQETTEGCWIMNKDQFKGKHISNCIINNIIKVPSKYFPQ